MQFNIHNKKLKYYTNVIFTFTSFIYQIVLSISGFANIIQN